MCVLRIIRDWLDGSTASRRKIERFQQAVCTAGIRVERHNRAVANLVDPKFHDMFWLSWRIEPLTDDPQERELLYTTDYWLRAYDAQTSEIRLISQAGGSLVLFFVAGDAITDGRLVLRGPYPADIGAEHGHEGSDER